MEIREVKMEQLDGRTCSAILEMEHEKKVSSIDWHAYWHSFRTGICTGFYEDQQLVGLVSVLPNCSYFENSILIHKVMYRWDYNTPDFIFAMLSFVVMSQSAEYVCIDVNRQRDWNYSLYLKFGFVESIMQSPVNAANTVLICLRSKLASKENTEKILDNPQPIC